MKYCFYIYIMYINLLLYLNICNYKTSFLRRTELYEINMILYFVLFHRLIIIIKFPKEILHFDNLFLPKLKQIYLIKRLY